MTIFDRLSQAGYKLTTPRRRILDALRVADTPLTALEVAARSGVSVASTYRALALLAELGAVSEITDPCAERAGIGGPGESEAEAEARGRRYAICATVGHHHHFTCRACHSTLDIASSALEQALAEIERTTGAHIERHQITLGGLCAGCQRMSDEHTATAGQA